MAERDTKATLPLPQLRDPGEVDPEHDTDAGHADGHDQWQLVGVYTPEQDFALEGDGKAQKIVPRGAITEPVAKYICMAPGHGGAPCGVVKEEPWAG
jgi:hypothetical protein